MKATFFTNSYNRLPLIKNLLRSFELCNQSREIEWVITDYGSTDGSRQWLTTYAANAAWPVKLIFGDEQEYFARLRVTPVNRRARIESILRKFRNDARRAARGEMLFDVGSDHQFIRPADFIAELKEVYDHRQQQIGHNDLSSVVAFGYFRWRLDKANNQRGREQNSEGTPYYLSSSKAYNDYNVMRRSEVDQIGPFVEVAELVPGSSRMEWWQAGNHLEMEYIDRCQKLGLQRAFLKFPLLITFRNSEAKQIVDKNLQQDELIVSLWTKDEMEKKFGWLSRPISSEELCRSMEPSLVDRGKSFISRWRR